MSTDRALSRLIRLLIAGVVALALHGSASQPAVAQQGSAPDLNAAAWILIDARSGEPLTGRSARERRPVASATKLMTARVAMQRLEMGEVVRAADYEAAPVESVIGLTPGESITVRDLIQGIILASGNDAAVTLAVAAAGSVPAFVRLMNAEAGRLGLNDTRFSNPIGLDQDGNLSSAADLAKLSQVLMRDTRFRRIAGLTDATLSSLEPPRAIETRNTLLLELPWADGIKTGYTLGAGYVLVGSGTRAGAQLISVVLGAPSMAARDAESRRLLEWGMSLYRLREPVARGQVLAVPEVRYSSDSFDLVADRPLRVAVRRGQSPRLEIRAPEEIEGPVSRGEALGIVRLLIEGRERGAARLLAARDLARAGPVSRLIHSPWAVSALALGLLFVILIAGAMHRRRRARRQGGFDSVEQG